MSKKSATRSARFGTALTAVLAVALTTPAGAYAATTASATHPGRGGHGRASGHAGVRISADLTALGRAKATGKPVAVAADTTETSVTVANPNGTFSMTLAPAPVRVKSGGRWRSIDATLHRTATGRWAPVAVPSGVSLSGGGAGPLAVMTSPAGGRLALTFPAKLPAPAVAGATARYRSVLPGVDLQVTATPLGGISEVLVIHDAAAAASPALRHLRLGLATHALSVSTDAAGNLRGIAPGGRTEFSAPPPLLWDSARHAAPASHRVSAGHRAPTGLTAASSPAGPGRGASTAPVRAQVAGHTLTLTPGTRLTGPAAYPEYLATSLTADPTNCNTVGSQNEECMAHFDEVQGATACQTYTNYDTQQGSGNYVGNAVGYDPGPPNFSPSCAPGEDRSFYAFDTSGLSSNMHIINATLTAWIRYGADFNCKDSHPLRVKLTDQIHSDTDWNNQPGVNSQNQTQEADVTSGPNPSSTCSEQTATFTGMGYALSMAAAQGWSVATFGFWGGTASDGDDWMRVGDYPDIVTTFDITPDAPTGLTTIPAPTDVPNGAADNGCGASPANFGWIGSASGGSGVNLSASIQSDISSEPVRAIYSATDDTTGQAISNPAGYDSAEDPGSQGKYSHWYSSGSATTNTPINFTLADGHSYTWSVQSEVEGIPGDPGYPDGPYDSGSSQSCGFSVDLTPPAQPTVASTAFPASGSGQQGQDAGTSGTFSFSSSDPVPTCSGCQASGVYEFEYALNTSLPQNVPSKPSCTNGQLSGSVAATNPMGTAKATSCSIPVSQWGTSTLHVAAIDKAGNVSQEYDYTFYAPWNPATKVTQGDIDGDGIPDLLGTTGSNLILYSGAKDPAVTPATIAGTEGESPDGGSPWNDFQIAHRGSMSFNPFDDLFVHKGPDMYLYLNGGGTSDEFNNTSSVNLITYPTHPSCAATANNASNCASYNVGNWSATTQILAPGDAWAGASGDTGLPSLLTVENGELWLYQGAVGNSLQDPVLLGSSSGTTNWSGMTLIAPGKVNGQLTIWALNDATGTIYSYPISIANGVPTLNSSSPGTPVQATSGPTISGISLPQSAYPAVASPGPLDGDTGSSGDPGSYPGLYAETTTGTAPSGASCSTGCLWYYPGQSTNGGTQPPLGTTPSFVGVLSTAVSQLS